MYKQIIIARKDLNMSAGKLAAQVSHASMAFLSWMIRNHVVGEVYDGNKFIGMNKMLASKHVYRVETFDIDKKLYDEWLDGAFTKAVLEAKNKNQLLKAKTLAEEIGMKEGTDFFLIRDNCYTELEPEEYDKDGQGRTLTCIGFRPMEAEIIDQIGKKYHIYTEKKKEKLEEKNIFPLGYVLESLAYKDENGRCHFTDYGAKMYCSSQATADVFYHLEEELKKYIE